MKNNLIIKGLSIEQNNNVLNEKLSHFMEKPNIKSQSKKWKKILRQHNNNKI